MILLITKGIWSSIALVPIIVVFLLVLFLLRRWSSIKHEREHHISIHHKANFRAFYYLAVEAPQQPALRFRFMAGKLPLVDVSRQILETKVAAVDVASVKSSNEKQKKNVSPASVSSAQSLQQRVGDGSSQLVAKTGIFANLLGTLAGLIPGSMGKGIKEQQENIRHAQVTGAKAAQAPKQAQQRISVIQAESQKLGMNQSAVASSHQVGTTPHASPNASNVYVDEKDEKAEQSTNTSQHPFGSLYCVETVELDPEQTLPLKLVISYTTSRPPIGSFAYIIYLQAVPLEQLQEKVPVLNKRGTVHYASVVDWRLFISSFTVLIIFLFGLLFWFYLLAIIWQ